MFLSMVIGTFFNERLKSRVSDLVAQVGAVRLFPHWMKLQWVEVKMADGVNVPFFVLCLAIHQEMENSSGAVRFLLEVCRYFSAVL